MPADATEAIKKHGGTALVRGGRHEALEGQARARNVVIEFESYDAARSYYFSSGISGRQGQARRRGGDGIRAGRRRMTMAKGYWIAHVDVTDPEAYKGYLAANAIAFAKFGARFLVRAGRGEVKGGALHPRHVVLEFKDYATALACYEFGGISSRHRVAGRGERLRRCRRRRL